MGTHRDSYLMPLFSFFLFFVYVLSRLVYTQVLEGSQISIGTNYESMSRKAFDLAKVRGYIVPSLDDDVAAPKTVKRAPLGTVNAVVS